MDEPILKAPLEEHLRPATDSAERERLLRSFRLREQGQLARRARRRRRGWLIGGAVMVAAAAALLIVLDPFAGEPADAGRLRLAEGGPLPAALESESGAPFELADGSRIALGAEAEAEIMRNDATQLRTRLTRGRADFEVEPGGSRRWVVEAADVRVEVVGTRFTVAHTDSGVEVRVARGIVEVHHASLPTPARLTRGESMTIAEPNREPGDEPAPPSSAAVVAPTREATPDTTPDTMTETTAETTDPTTRAADAPALTAEPGWRARAERGDFDGAYRLLGPAGLRAEGRRSGPRTQLLLADVARRSGHPQEAVPLLRSVMARTDAHASVAAFTLGRLQLHSLDEPAAAARSFAFVIERGRAGALRPDAMALRAEAHARAGQGEPARAAAQAYLVEHPEGRRAPAMRRLASGR